MEAPASSFDRILNFRDVGQSINQFAGKRTIKEGVLFRSARPGDATEADRRVLTDRYGIKTVIDLRSKTEHILQSRKRGSSVPSSSLAPQTNTDTASPLAFPGMTTYAIDLQGRPFQIFLFFKLSFVNMLRLIFNMIIGNRPDAIRVIGKNVMAKRGLTQLGKDTLDTSGKAIGEAVRIISNEMEQGRPVVVHCTQGKDRTGLIVLLLLLLLGDTVDRQWIQEDYVMSEAELVPEREERVAEIVDMGMPESFADCPPDFVREMVGHLERKYGGVEGYLTHRGVGLGEDEMRVIKRTLLD